jgi:hypothetical protein
MKDLLDVLEQVAELLYQEQMKEAYGILVKCIPLMSAYLGELSDTTLQGEIMASLNTAVGAMEQNDYTLLADVLQYDIIEKLRGLEED